LKRVRYCFITHEHPDHFHTASIRVLGKAIQYLSPEFPEEHISAYLNAQGFRAEVVRPFEWRTLHPDLRVLSIPLFNDDSVLLLETPQAFIINLNDSKPRRGQLLQLRRYLDEVARGKTRILLSSYSPASIVNSFMRDGARVNLRMKQDYVHFVSDNCDLLEIDYFMPFASQVVYRRTDSEWANEFKVTFDDLKANWRARRTVLLPPFCRVDLRDNSYTFEPPAAYRGDIEAARPKVEAQQALDAATELDAADSLKLARKLNRSRWFLAPLFPRGLGFRLDSKELHYSPWTGRIEEGRSDGTVTFNVPTGAFKDVIAFDHFGDLGITMFTIVVLNRKVDPRWVYVFIFLMTLHDYGHTVSFRSFQRWIAKSLQVHRWTIPRPTPWSTETTVMS
jgi:hypothetical protein